MSLVYFVLVSLGPTQTEKSIQVLYISKLGSSNVTSARMHLQMGHLLSTTKRLHMAMDPIWSNVPPVKRSSRISDTLKGTIQRFMRTIKVPELIALLVGNNAQTRRALKSIGTNISAMEKNKSVFVNITFYKDARTLVK